MTLVSLVAEIAGLRRTLSEHEAEAKKRAATLRAEIDVKETTLNRIEAGLDLDMIALAESVISVDGLYQRAGDERASARHDAIQWLALGAAYAGRTDMRREYFGTKSYDRWHGQRCDCEYGMGPRHGSIIFRIGLRREARARDLSDAEREAAVYYLTHLEAIQGSRKAAA